MAKLRTFAFPIVIALQVLSVLGFAGVREATLRTGQEVVLQTVPVDPRDLFRGDYVVLRYTISTLDECYGWEVGSDVYVNLERRGDVWQADGYKHAAPESGTFIRGKVTGKLPKDRCQVEYGIESYFVPEGSGKAIERAQVPVRIKASIDGFGNAVIKDLVMGSAAEQPAAVSPDSGLAWYQLRDRGETRWRQGDYAGAVDDFKLAVPRTVVPWQRSQLAAMQVQARVSSGDLTGALDEVEAALNSDKSPVLRETRGYVLLKLGRNDEALADFQQALRDTPSADSPSKTAFVGRAIALCAIGETIAGLRDLDAGLRHIDKGKDTGPYAQELIALGKAAQAGAR